MIRESNSAEETESIAGEFARTLSAGVCVALEGDLGAGKTAFVRGLVRGLGGDVRQVSSPTFVLMHIYDTSSLKVFHLDAYRVGGADDFESIGFSELLEQGGVVIVEWASRVTSIIPTDAIHISISATGENARTIEVL